MFRFGRKRSCDGKDLPLIERKRTGTGEDAESGSGIDSDSLAHGHGVFGPPRVAQLGTASEEQAIEMKTEPQLTTVPLEPFPPIHNVPQQLAPTVSTEKVAEQISTDSGTEHTPGTSGEDETDKKQLALVRQRANSIEAKISTAKSDSANSDFIAPQVPEVLSRPLSWFSASFSKGGAQESQSEEPNDDDEVPSKVPVTDGWTGFLARVQAVILGPYLLLVIFLATAVGLVCGALSEYGYDFDFFNLFRFVDWDKEINVAFIGNAYLFVNDVPRVMEAISDSHIRQNSVIHAGGSLGSLLATGNGMYKAWQTEAADIGLGYYENYGGYRKMYDFGSCSVVQILQGYDELVDYGNSYGAYYDDGLNPCIMDRYYGQYVADQFADDPPNWDFVVLADQTKRTAVEEAREDTVTALMYHYGPFLNVSGATPVIVDTHAFYSENTNMTGLGDVPTFTSLIYEGVDAYVEALSSVLPKSQAPIVAPIGIAYLTVWEENRDLWKSLFLGDMIHSSAHGTYLFANVLYATMFRHMPNKEASIPNNMSYLFHNSRKLAGQFSFPSTEEAVYLRNVARRVVLRGHVPSSFERA